jgi:hypothetical protein
MKIEIKSILGNVLFEYECKNNTIKKTVEKAVKERVNLSYSDLSGLNLRGSNLSGLNLRNSYLSGSDLRNSNLRNSDLSGSNLRNSDLRGSNLSGSNLRGSNLLGSNLLGSNLSGSENKELAYFQIFCIWNHCILGDKIKIGCQVKNIEEWEVFFNSKEEYSTKRNTPEFKQIQAVYLAYKAYLIHLK